MGHYSPVIPGICQAVCRNFDTPPLILPECRYAGGHFKNTRHPYGVSLLRLFSNASTLLPTSNHCNKAISVMELIVWFAR